jgi:secreted trypsin-like serine protease
MLLLLPLTVAVLGIAPGSPARAIAGGQDVADGRYPFAVKLTMTDIPAAGGGSRNSSCSGALVAPQWVITAGHCFRNTKGTRVSRPVARLTTVTVGRTDLSDTSGHKVKVIAVRQSPTTDVALAKIATPVTDIEPVRLSSKRPRVGTVVRLAGYGLTADNDPSTLAKRLQTGQFEVVSVARGFVGMTGRAPRRTTSPCKRDSGGPYFAQQGDGPAVLVAVVSSGPSCPHSKVDQSGRIDTIASWITGIVGKPAATTTSKPASPRKPAAPAGPGATATDTKLVGAAPTAGASMATRAAMSAVVILGFGTAIALLIGSRRRSRAYVRKGIRRHRR